MIRLEPLSPVYQRYKDGRTIRQRAVQHFVRRRIAIRPGARIAKRRSIWGALANLFRSAA